MVERDLFPFAIEDVEDSKGTELMKYFKNEHSGFVRVGPKGYLLPKKYREHADHIYNLAIRPDDVIIAGFLRSGNTLMRELVWNVVNDFNIAEAVAVPLHKRYVMFKEQLLNENEQEVHKQEIERITRPGYEQLDATISRRRIISSHLPLSLLPPRLLDTSKVVYMARDPRDVIVSFYHYNRLFRVLTGFDGDFKTFWNFFKNDCVERTPYFESLKEAWQKRHHPNMLFQFYEHVTKDLPSAIRRIAKFLNSPHTEEQVTCLAEHLAFDNFKNNKSVNSHVIREIGLLTEWEQPFIRKGKSGGWRDYFTGELEQEVNDWILENLRDTDLKFPTMTQEL